MPSWPVALSGMMAAGYAATQAQKAGYDSPSLLVGTVLKGLGGDGSGPAAGRVGGNSELSVMQGEMDRLHKLLADVVRGQKGGSGYTVIHAGGRSGWTYLIMPAAIGAAGFYAYAKWKGVSISDFFVVTNKSMQNFRELVSASFTSLWDELRKHKDEFLSRFTVLGTQQQQMMAQQNAMDERLGDVSNNVDEIRETTSNIDNRVGRMDHHMQVLGSNMQKANEGIFLLCAAVADVTRRIGMDNSNLKQYVQAAPPELTAASPGLRHLLMEGAAAQDVGQGTVPLPLIQQLPDSLVNSGSLSGSASSVGGRAGRGAAGGEVQVDAVANLGVLYRRDALSSAPSGNARNGNGVFGALWNGGSANGRSKSVASNGN